MAIVLDDKLLRELGLDELPAAHRRVILRGIYEELEISVGRTLAGRMSDSQVREFETYIDRQDEDGALEWLNRNMSDYKTVVAQEFERLCAEIRAMATDISLLSAMFDIEAEPSSRGGAVRGTGDGRSMP